MQLSESDIVQCSELDVQVLDLFLAPAELEEVVRRVDDHLHFAPVLQDGAENPAVDAPHTLCGWIVAENPCHLRTQRGQIQRRSQDFCLGGATRPMPPATFSVISGSRRGGVVPEISRDPRERTTFSGGGGSGRHFPGNYGWRSIKLPQSRDIFVYIYGPPQRNNINSLQKNPFTKRLGGMAPVAPLATPLVRSSLI